MSTGPDGLDASPRDDPAPLVRIRDERTILLPERRGPHRIDGLRNIVHDPRVSLFFFVPGVRETLRVDGTARISIEPRLLASFTMQGRLPKCVVEASVQAVYFQCGRALLRSSLWTGTTIREFSKSRPRAGCWLHRRAMRSTGPTATTICRIGRQLRSTDLR